MLAKLLCNQLNMPVIIMKSFDDRNEQLVEFISSINTDVILFYDEFEKTFSEEDSTILKLMDGIYNPKSRKVHILTTNQLYINNNLLNRPSRLRYLINFNSLENKIVESYIKDNLNDMQYYDKILELVGSLSDISIDILKQIISEINLFGFDSFDKYKDIFNIEFNKYNYDIICTEWFSSGNIKEDLIKAQKQLLEFKNYIAVSDGEDDDDNKDDNSENKPKKPKFDYYFYESDTSTSKSFYLLKQKDRLMGGDIIYINHESCMILVRDRRGSYRLLHILNPYSSNNQDYSLVL